MANMTFNIFARDDNASRTFDKVGSAAERAGKKVDRAGRTSFSAGTRFGKMSLGVGKAFSGLASGLPVAGAAVVGLGLLGKGVLDSAVQLQALDRRAKLVYGNALPQVAKWARQVGDRAGVTSRQVLGLTASFETNFRSMGLGAHQARQLSQQMFTVSAAVAEASGGQVDAAAAAEIVSAAFRGEYDSAQTLGIQISDAAVKAEMLRQKQHGVKFATDAQAQAMAAATLIMRGTTQQQKLYAEGQGTLASNINKAKTRIAELRDALIVKVTPWLTTAFTWFNAHWYDIADGLLVLAQGGIALIGPMGAVAAVGLRVGAALLYAAGAAAFAKGDIASANRTWTQAKGLNELAGQASRLGEELQAKATPAVARLRAEIAQLKSKNVTVSVTQETIYRSVDLGGGRRAKTVGMNAAGTPRWRGGLTWVGEEGAELIDLPAGTRIYDAQESAQIAKSAAAAGSAAGGGTSYTFITNVSGALDPDAVGEQVVKLIRRHVRMTGSTVLGM